MKKPLHRQLPRLSTLSLCVMALGVQAQAPSAPVSKLDSVTISGQAASLRKALAAQQKADHIVSVISADDIGTLPDKNAAEALARLPGISVQRDQGEGRYVVIRGLGADLNAVTLNGSLVPAPENSRRGVALDTVPAGMVRTLEVSKTLTPDRDANSIGGTVEVKTLSAFDLPGSLLAGGLGLSYDQNLGKTSPSANVLWAQRFMNGTFGVALGAGTEKREFASDNVETGGAWTDGRLSGFELRDYLPVRERHALAASLDYRPSAKESFFLRAFLSQFSDDEVRERLSIGNVSNSTATPGGNFAEGQVVTARAERRLRQRKYTQEISSLTLGGESQWDAWTLQASIGLGRASEDTPESINDARFRQNGVAGVSFTDSRIPRLNGPATLYTPASYALNGFTLQARNSQDQEQNLKLDLIHNSRVDGRDVEIKFGGKTSRREKTNDTNQWSYNSSNTSSPNFWGAGPTTLAGFAQGDVDYALGTLGPGINPALVRERLAGLARDPARLLRESTLNDFTLNEDIKALYAQGSLDLSKSWNLLAGLRVERTQFEAKGSQISPANVVLPLAVSQRSSEWLPGLHSRYNLDAQTSIRAAWWNSVVRANFSQLAPGISLASPTEAVIGNPNLKPLRSRNLDLGIERMLTGGGVVSAYLFDKDIKDFTYTTNLAGTGAWTGYTTATSYANGDKAAVRGAELAYSQPLRQLPGLLSGLIVGANATFSTSSATLSRFDRSANAVLSRDVRLPGHSKTVLNLMLGYEAGPISTRLALNQKSAYLLELGPDLLSAAQERWVDRQRQIDFSFAYQLDKRWQLVAEALNLNNEKYYVYQGSRAFNTQFEQYGRTVKLTLKATAF